MPLSWYILMLIYCWPDLSIWRLNQPVYWAAFVAQVPRLINAGASPDDVRCGTIFFSASDDVWRGIVRRLGQIPKLICFTKTQNTSKISDGHSAPSPCPKLFEFCRFPEIIYMFGSYWRNTTGLQFFSKSTNYYETYSLSLMKITTKTENRFPLSCGGDSAMPKVSSGS